MPTNSSVKLTSKGICKRIASGEITFDNIIQRNLVWDKNRKSLFIHSLTTGWMPVPPIYCIKGECTLDVIEGKQRLTTLPSFMNDEFALSGVPEFDEDGNPFETDDGTLIGDINGKKFSELPEVLQDNIKDFGFSIQAFENISSALISEIFIRINNGKSLSAIELAWVKAKCKAQISTIINHPIFPIILTPAAINKYGDIKIAMFAWCALFQSMEEISFESKKFRPTMAVAEITEEQVNTIMEVLTRIQHVYEAITTKDGTDEEKVFYAKVAKKISTQTHLLSILKVVKESIDKGVSEETVTDWCLHFFAGTGRATISEIYNDNSYQATNGNASLNKRFNAVNLDYQTYVRAHVHIAPTNNEAVKVSEEISA